MAVPLWGLLSRWKTRLRGLLNFSSAFFNTPVASAVNSAGESYLSSIKTYNSDGFFLIDVDSIGVIQAGQSKSITGNIQSSLLILKIDYSIVDSSYIQAIGISRTANSVTEKKFNWYSYRCSFSNTC